jgi:hypothetical protein
VVSSLGLLQKPSIIVIREHTLYGIRSFKLIEFCLRTLGMFYVSWHLKRTYILLLLGVSWVAKLSGGTKG